MKKVRLPGSGIAKGLSQILYLRLVMGKKSVCAPSQSTESNRCIYDRYYSGYCGIQRCRESKRKEWSHLSRLAPKRCFWNNIEPKSVGKGPCMIGWVWWGWGWVLAQPGSPRMLIFWGHFFNRHSMIFEPELLETESEVAKASGNVLIPLVFISLVLIHCSIFLLPRK